MECRPRIPLFSPPPALYIGLLDRDVLPFKRESACHAGEIFRGPCDCLLRLLSVKMYFVVADVSPQHVSPHAVCVVCPPPIAGHVRPSVASARHALREDGRERRAAGGVQVERGPPVAPPERLGPSAGALPGAPAAPPTETGDAGTSLLIFVALLLYAISRMGACLCIVGHTSDL